jgi:hypothetical protein
MSMVIREAEVQGRTPHLDDFYSDGRDPWVTPEFVFETSGIVDRGGDGESVFGWDFGTAEPGLEVMMKEMSLDDKRG